MRKEEEAEKKTNRWKGKKEGGSLSWFKRKKDLGANQETPLRKGRPGNPNPNH